MRNNREPRFLLVFHLFQYLLQHVQVELIYEPRILKTRDKISRREKAPFGIDPSGQRLFVTYMPAHRSHNRLVINDDPMFPNRAVKVRQDILPFYGVILERGAIIVEGGGDRVLYRITG